MLIHGIEDKNERARTLHSSKSRIAFGIKAISKIVIVSVIFLVAIGALLIGIFLVPNISHSTSSVTNNSSVITMGTCEVVAYVQEDLTNLSYVYNVTITTNSSTTYSSATFLETEPPPYATTTSTYYLVTHASAVSNYTLTNSTSSGGQGCYPSYCYTVATCAYSP
jgi:hypothetical protein